MSSPQHHTSYRFRVEDAKRLASLGGIEQDLEGVVRYCDMMIERSDITKLNVYEWEALGAAAVVRYARCFNSGVRDPLSTALLQEADAELKQFHEYVLSLRSKHIAHSVNPFEDNEVMIQVGSHFRTSLDIAFISTYHSRLIALSVDGPEKLKRLAEWVLGQVRLEMKTEKAKLLSLVRSIPLETIRTFGELNDFHDTSAEVVRTSRAKP